MFNLTSKFGNIRNPNEPETPTYPENPHVIIQPPVYYPIPPDWTDEHGIPQWTTPSGQTTTIPPVIVMNNQPTSAQCSCLTGEAYINTQGNCACRDNSQPVKTIDTNPQGQLVYYMMPQTAVSNQQSAVSSFDLGQFVKDNPLLVGGLILGTIFLATRK